MGVYMKNLLSMLLVFSFLFTIGCEDDEATTSDTLVGVWNMTSIAVVYDGPNNRVLLYVNGSFVEEKSYSSTRTAEISNFQFGNWANSRPFDGLITDFRIWNDTRTESEIQNNNLKR